jgi:hypothetical protein
MTGHSSKPVPPISDFHTMQFTNIHLHINSFVSVTLFQVDFFWMVVHIKFLCPVFAYLRLATFKARRNLLHFTTL